MMVGKFGFPGFQTKKLVQKSEARNRGWKQYLLLSRTNRLLAERFVPQRNARQGFRLIAAGDFQWRNPLAFVAGQTVNGNEYLCNLRMEGSLTLSVNVGVSRVTVRT